MVLQQHARFSLVELSLHSGDCLSALGPLACEMQRRTLTKYAHPACCRELVHSSSTRTSKDLALQAHRPTRTFKHVRLLSTIDARASAVNIDSAFVPAAALPSMESSTTVDLELRRPLSPAS